MKPSPCLFHKFSLLPVSPFPLQIILQALLLIKFRWFEFLPHLSSYRGCKHLQICFSRKNSFSLWYFLSDMITALKVISNLFSKLQFRESATARERTHSDQTFSIVQLAVQSPFLCDHPGGTNVANHWYWYNKWGNI